MMGETANIQVKDSIPYFQFIVLRYKTPYYKKITQRVGEKKPLKIETINKHDLLKYVNLVLDSSQAHKPKTMSLSLIDIDEKSANVNIVDFNKVFEKDFAILLNEKLSINNFFKEIKCYKIYLDNK